MTHSQTRSAPPHEFRCFGQRVIIAPRADATRDFRPGGKYAWMVAEILKDIEPFKELDFTETVEGFPVQMPLRTVQISSSSRIEWAQHTEHHAAHPGLSPFVQLPYQPLTRTLTVQLVMSGKTPMLVRAYAGGVEPPLPWMKSAQDYDEGGRAGCIKYWRRHAFVLTRGNMRRSTLTRTTPNWAR